MTRFTPIAALAAAALIAMPASASDREVVAEQPLTKGAEKLMKMLEGRTAGEPQNCIHMRRNVDLTVIDSTALVYKSGSTLYVNIPDNADDVDEDDALVTRSSTNSLCSTSIVTTVDRFHGNYTGNISLGKFVPYRKDS